MLVKFKKIKKGKKSTTDKAGKHKLLLHQER